MKRPKPDKTKTVYFIRRDSHVDDSRWFNAQGRRVWFVKAAWASWLLANFDLNQNAKVVLAPVLETDMAYEDFLPSVLSDEVAPEEYISAIEETMRDRRSGGSVSNRAARSFLKRMRRQSAMPASHRAMI